MMIRGWRSRLFVLVLLAGGVLLAGRMPASAAGALSSWKILNPLSPTADISRIACPDAATCFAAARNGTIIQTHDGGRTWTSRRVSTANRFQALSCSSVTTCLVAADKATVFSTADGGATWQPHTNVTTYQDMGVTSPPGGPPPLVDMACPSAAVCYAPVGFADSQGAFILLTVNGGLTWQTQTIPGYGTFTPESIACPAVQTCFMAGTGGVILVTRDGGRNWHSQTSGTTDSLMRVTCPSVTTCLILANGPTAGLLRTSDGGATWTAQPYPRTAPDIAIACPGVQICFRAGLFDVSASTDGGVTWKTRIQVTDNFLSDITCPTATTCHVVGQRGTMIRTDNGGTTWAPETRGTTNLLAGIACPAASTCYATGDTGTMLKTTDGSTWVAQTTGTNGPFTGMACPGPSTCYAVQGAAGGTNGRGTVWGTSDGNTWRRQTTGPALFGIACPSVSTCYAVGAGTSILATSDGGRTWNKLGVKATALPLLRVACSSAQICVAVGGSSKACTNAGCSRAHGIMALTSNGGKTWQEYQLKAIFLTGIACPAARTCYAAGSNFSVRNAPAVPLVMVTRDAGRSWHDVRTPRTTGAAVFQPGATACRSVAVCYVVMGPAVLGTSNGGQTWSDLGSPLSGAGPATAPLQGIACPAKQTCYVVGPGGLIAVNRHLSAFRG